MSTHRHKDPKTGKWITDVVTLPDPVVSDLTPLLDRISALENGRVTTAELATAVVGLDARLRALETPAPPPVPVPDPVPPPVPVPVPSNLIGIGSAYAHTKDNIQVRQNGNGNVAFQLRKRGTGPITGIGVQDRFGTSKEVYHKGDGGLYSVAALLGGPDGTVIGSTTWRPGLNGGQANAAFPDILFPNPTADVLDHTPFWMRFLNIHASPDANYVSLNTLLCFGGEPNPRQPAFANTDLTVLVNTGSGWHDFKRTMNCDVLPNHEGFGYTQGMPEEWKPIGGSDQVRQTFDVKEEFTFSQIAVVLRRVSGSNVPTATLETAVGASIVSASLPASGLAAGQPGSDNSGQGLVRGVVPATTIPAGTYRLRLTCPSGSEYAMAPVRKPVKGSYPTLLRTWGSYTCPGGFGEYSSDGGKTWASMYGNKEVDIQFGLLP